jgi:hypothetical protein
VANTLTNIIPTIFARALLALRGRTVMPRLVNTDYSMEAKEKGDTITINVPTAVTTEAVTPSQVPPAPGNTTPGKVSLSLNNWRKSTPFHLTDKELKEANVNETFIPGQFSEAIKALANYVNAQIMALYTGVYGFVGTTGVTPFDEATPVVDIATQARKILNRQEAPLDDRRVVLDFDAEAAALALPAFSSAEKIGGDQVIRSGNLGHIFGFDWYSDSQVPTHSESQAGTALVDDGAGVAVGLKTVHMDGLTTKPEAGDIFTINRLSSSDPSEQTYVVVSSTALVGTDSDVTFEPGLAVALAAGDDNSPIVWKGDYVANLAFHRDAFAFASRPLMDEASMGGSQGQTFTMADPITGLVFRLEEIREYKQTAWELDILFGVALVRAELACIMAG